MFDFKFFLDFCFKITESDNNRFEDDGKFIKDWKQIAISQSHTIKDLRKKVKVLQQKIRRHTTKIETLKVRVLFIYLFNTIKSLINKKVWVNYKII